MAGKETQSLFGLAIPRWLQNVWVKSALELVLVVAGLLGMIYLTEHTEQGKVILTNVQQQLVQIQSGS